MNINMGRVVLGGLLAGLIINIGEFVLNDFILGAQMKTWLAAHNFAEPGGSFIACAVGLTFVMGIVIVLTYALIRPRLGPGVKTAIFAGLLMWFAACLYVGTINGMLFGIPMNVIALAIGWSLIEYLLAAIAGAWVYKEA